MFLKRSPISTFLFFNFFFISLNVQAEGKVAFDPALLQFSDGKSAKDIDLDYFSDQGSGIAPGVYSVEITVNGESVSQQKINFAPNNDNVLKLHACFNTALLSEIGIDTTTLNSIDQENQCQNIEKIFPGAKEKFITNEMKLFLDIPQIYLNKTPVFKVPPTKWDNGLNVFFVNYDFNGNQQKSGNEVYQSNFFGFNSGINIQGWRLRHNFNIINTKDSNKLNSLDTYIKKSFSALQGGEITLGQTNTDGSLFDSIPISGLNIASNDQMLSSYMNAFSPVIRGIASSPSRVTVKQNGTIIFQKNVSTGPFEFRDIPQAIGSQNLLIEIKGIDGKTRSYTQTSSTVPMLLRSGRTKYSLTIGKYNNKELNKQKPNIIQATIGWGLDSTTIYSGAQVSNNYQSLMIGVAKYFEKVGALSLDATHAYTTLSKIDLKSKRNKESGSSFRINYAKNFEETGTNFNLTGYRYAEKNFYSFTEAQQLGSKNDKKHIKSSITSTISQNVNNAGALSLSGSVDSYWNNEDSGHTLQIGYNSSFFGNFFNISASVTKNPSFNQTDKIITMMLSRPLFNNGASTYYMLTKSSSGYKNQLGVSGTMLDKKNLDYSAYGSNESEGSKYTSGFNANYHGSIGDIGGGINISGENRQIDYSAHGGLLASGYGIVLSKPISVNGGNALIVTPNAPGIRINNDTTVNTNDSGLAVISGLSPFSKNTISLDVNSVSNNIELGSTDKTITPDEGAIVLSKFKTAIGNKALFTVRKHGDFIPFGSVATLKSNGDTITGIVDNDGMLYLGGLPNTGKINIQWGRNNNEQCIAEYTLPKQVEVIGEMSLDCK